MLDLLIILAFTLLFITLVFAVAMKLKRLDVVDIAWGGAFIVVAKSSFFLGAAQGELQLLTSLLVIVWGLRLAYTIFVRFKNAKREDPRYTELKKKWPGSLYLNAYGRIFATQGLLAVVVSLSVIVINLSEVTDIGSYALIGALIWLIGFYFEAVGDAQLKNHLADPENHGKLMTSGLWRYTRHPNYFGEATQWWGIWVIALSVPYGWVTILAPLTISYLLLAVSGIPMTEKRFVGRPGWAEYKARTSAFLPLPPRSD